MTVWNDLLMASAPASGMTPRERVQAECARRGKDAVVADCLRLLAGETADLDLLSGLAGPGADKYFDGAQHDDTYWFRVWAMRGLLWSYDPRAEDAVRAGFADDSWRVREMAAKVVARHLVGPAISEVAAGCHDPVPRVRSASERALIRLNEANA